MNNTEITILTRFSVLLSIYIKEQPQYLEAALSSIWDVQTHKPNEIILVEDGPLTNELEAIINKWKTKLDDALKVIPLKKNVGLGNALNEGLKHCSFDWVFRMDTDDIATPDRFEKQIKFITNHPDIVLIGGQIQEFKGTPENITVQRLVPTTSENINEYAKKRAPFNHPTVAYRKDIIQNIGGYQHHLLMEDYNLWLRLLAAGYKTANLPDTLLYMRTDDMHGRRRGLKYIKSEWQLFQLKRELKFQPTISAFIFFIARALPRLLPASALQFLYKILRK